MKKLITVIFFLAIHFTVFSQEGPFIGARVIPQSAWILNQDDFDSNVMDFKTPFSVALGIAGGYMFNDLVGVEVNLLYSPQGQNYISDSSKADLFNKKNNYLKIPVLFRYRSESDKAAFLFSAGPELGFLMGSKLTFPNAPDIDTKQYYNSFDFSVLLQIGTSIMIGDKSNLDILLRFNYGLSNIENGTSSADYPVLFPDLTGNGRQKANNASAGMTIGYNFTLSK
jgi:outer membrane protein with beta-barrel domain